MNIFRKHVEEVPQPARQHGISNAGATKNRVLLAAAVVKEPSEFAQVYGNGGPKACKARWPSLNDYDVKLLRNHWGLPNFQMYPARRKPPARPANPIELREASPLTDDVMERLANRVVEILIERLIR